LRLVCYNLLEGLRPVGAGPGGADPGGVERRQHDRQRLDAARAVIVALAPDILVLNEALYCVEHGGTSVDYGSLFGFPHQACALYDGAWGNAILSRWPVTEQDQMRIYNRGGLIARIESPDGPLTVASYHPHPGRFPGNKAADFVRLIGDRTGPRVLCGDLNCISPEDPVDRERLIEGFRRFSPEPEATVDQFLDSGRAVFAALARVGLRDAVPPRGRRHTIPTDLIDTDKRSAMRIDHVLVSDEVEVLGGEVVHTPDTERASDHHPVRVDLALRGEALALAAPHATPRAAAR
jgi:endonuclease/exonuclease/phosphatase family metal-dependent hydrolase